MRYLFILTSIVIIWLAIIIIANTVLAANSTLLFLAAQSLTLVLFYVGFYRK